MTFPRGFKADCERLVNGVREELLISADSPIDMDQLADHLEIPVFPLARLMKIANQPLTPSVAAIYNSVSAFTIFRGSHRTIIFNDRHPLPRHRSNLAHELAHALLMHPAEKSGISADKEAQHEKEANWLGGVLMLTARQAHQIATRRMSGDDAIRVFQLSPEMLRYRLNVTGASKAGQPVWRAA